MSKTSDKKEIDRHDSDLYWTTTIKVKIQCFSFITIMEHTANIIKPKQGLITSSLKVFAMFELCLIDDINKVESIDIRCINCKKETGLYLRTSTSEEMIYKFALNAILHHVSMLWIICSNEEMEDEIDKSNNTNWLNKGPWYITSICSRFHGSMFEGFITHARINIYNLM